MLALAGDISLSGLILDNNYKPEDALSEVIVELKDYSLVCNLESPVLPDDYNTGNSHLIYTREKPALRILNLLNVKVVSLANNHIAEYGEYGLVSTIRFLKAAGIKYTGAGLNTSDIEPCIFNIGSTSYALIAYVHEGTNIRKPQGSRILINQYNADAIEREIRSLTGQVDKIVLSLHWGRDYSHFYERWQREDAERFISAGATIIAGHHPHTLQPYEKLNGSHVFYSLGGLVFGDFVKDGRMRALRLSTKKSIIALEDTSMSAFTFLPTRDTKGNIIKIGGRNTLSSLNRKQTISKTLLGYRRLYHFCEFLSQFSDRIYDYFWGYYRRPLRDIFRKGFLKKAGYLVRDWHIAGKNGVADN